MVTLLAYRLTLGTECVSEVERWKLVSYWPTLRPREKGWDFSSFPHLPHLFPGAAGRVKGDHVIAVQ